ncbi:PQQ-binding-like beta-propeller repeat protein [Leifsonia sp. McL0607]|uniref:outer membrane protein assembly factor BamB family protein n=1 Tax=Leifsonia sp. McL0607 TaxID=3415672 RepID=UPI003CEDC21E
MSSIEHMPGVTAPDWLAEPQVEAVTAVEETSLLTGQPVNVAFNGSALGVTGVGAIFAGEDGRVRFFDSTLERTYWTRRMDAGVYSSLVAVPGTEEFIVASVAGMIVRLDLRGRARWVSRLGHSVFGTIAFLHDERTAVIPTFDHRAFLLDLHTGQVVASVDTRGGSASRFESAFAYRRALYASPTVRGDGCFVVADHEAVSCFDPSGTVMWETRAAGLIRSSPVAVGDATLTCTTAGVLQRWDAAGNNEYSVRIGGRIDASATVHSGLLIVSGRGVGTSSYDVGSGELRWRSPTIDAFEYTSVIALPSGVCVITSERGTVVGLDANTGDFLWETSQVLGRPDRSTSMETTPAICADGSMYVASYSGDCYRFRFPDQQKEDPQR